MGKEFMDYVRMIASVLEEEKKTEESFGFSSILGSDKHKSILVSNIDNLIQALKEENIPYVYLEEDIEHEEFKIKYQVDATILGIKFEFYDYK